MDFLLANLNLVSAEKGGLSSSHPDAVLRAPIESNQSVLEGSPTDLYQVIEFKDFFGKAAQSSGDRESSGLPLQELPVANDNFRQAVKVPLPLDAMVKPAAPVPATAVITQPLPDVTTAVETDGDALPASGKFLPDGVTQTLVSNPASEPVAKTLPEVKAVKFPDSGVDREVPVSIQAEPREKPTASLPSESRILTGEIKPAVRPDDTDLLRPSDRQARIENLVRAPSSELSKMRPANEPIRNTSDTRVAVDPEIRITAASPIVSAIKTGKPVDAAENLPHRQQPNRQGPVADLQSVRQLIHTIDSNDSGRPVTDKPPPDIPLARDQRPIVDPKIDRVVLLPSGELAMSRDVKPVLTDEGEMPSRPVISQEAKWLADKRASSVVAEPVTASTSVARSAPEALPADVVPLRVTEPVSLPVSTATPTVVPQAVSYPAQVQLTPLAIPHADSLNPGRLVDASEWGNGLGERVSWMINQKQNTATIRIDPPVLGKLDVQVRIAEDSTLITIQTQHAQTREIIESASYRLRDYLQENGYQNVNVDVSQRQDNAQSRGQSTETETEQAVEDSTGDLAGDSPELPTSQHYVTDGLIDTFA